MNVVVLMSTYDGSKFLREQLDSIFLQSANDVHVEVRDDGSADSTCEILEEYARTLPLSWAKGEHVGIAQSFWDLLQHAETADYYALCDQDDVWDSDKLECAIRILSNEDGDMPVLYCGSARVVDADLRDLRGPRQLPRKLPRRHDYLYSLVRNISPGCTFVFNHAARELLCRYDARKLGIELHDWTAFQIVACFGQVFFDTNPHMSYRQHRKNAIGANQSRFLGLAKKAPAFWKGDKRNARRTNAQRLESAFADTMSADNLELTMDFAHYNDAPARKKRLFFKHAAQLEQPYRSLFRLLILFNRL